MIVNLFNNFLALFDRSEPIPADDVTIAMQVHETLSKHYPGHGWGVGVDSKQGLMKIHHGPTMLTVDGQKAFVLHMNGFYSASQMDEVVVRAGGEILERNRLRRGAFDEDQWLNLRTDFAGRYKPDMN